MLKCNLVEVKKYPKIMERKKNEKEKENQNERMGVRN